MADTGLEQRWDYQGFSGIRRDSGAKSGALDDESRLARDLKTIDEQTQLMLRRDREGGAK